jgi:nicotinamide phosphoribosyltransferase
MKGLISTLLCDFYKCGHREQYPEGTETVYATWTPRSNRHASHIEKVTAVGFQGFIKEYLIEEFDDNFFSRPKAEVVAEYARYIKYCLFVPDPYTKHIEDLHDLGYMPLKVCAVPEGTQVPMRVPLLTVENTHPEFFWVTNYIETLMSNTLWKVATNASTAKIYRELLNDYALRTTGTTAGVEFQGHDFSMRGMSGLEDSARSGIGHLLSFVGTDTIPAIQYAEAYYGANVETELVGCSVNATEHSVMCAGGAQNEYETYRRLVEDIYPTGIISIVSDTWDLWHVLTDTLPKLKDVILNRDSGIEGAIDKVVIRPDSGDPADIICGDPLAPAGTPANLGVVRLLHQTFGAEKNDEGFFVLNPKIGAIYGDAITIERCTDICERLFRMGYASTNVIYGIGSYTYQFNTRDTLGFAMKSTSVTIDGTETPIFKDPVTDDGTKKSAKGRVTVHQNDDGDITYCDVDSSNMRPANILQPIFEDGVLLRETTLAEIKAVMYPA